MNINPWDNSGGSGNGDSINNGGTGPTETHPKIPLNTYFTVDCHAREDDNDGGYAEITMAGTIPIDSPAVDRDWNIEPLVSLGTTGGGYSKTMHYTLVDFNPCHGPDCGDCKYTYDADVGMTASMWRLPPAPVTEWKVWFAPGFDSGNSVEGVKQVLPGCTDPAGYYSHEMAESYLLMCFNGPEEEFPLIFRDGEVIKVKGLNNGANRDVTYAFHISAK
jgi:hypothetical protein